METPGGPITFLSRLAAVLKGIALKLQRKKPPAMIGLPPSARGLKAVPDDTEEHVQAQKDRSI